MKIRTWLLMVVLLAAGWFGRETLYTWIEFAPERVVVALPGIGGGWVDTLRRVAGYAPVDTISSIMLSDEGDGLLGIFESWHNKVFIRTDMQAYFSDQRIACNIKSFDYVHPVTTANPAAVIAHEFGHRFQLSLHQTGTLPRWANDYEERFADRFARAMLVVRGWDTPDSSDLVLTHRVKYLLIKSYWGINGVR